MNPPVSQPLVRKDSKEVCMCGRSHPVKEHPTWCLNHPDKLKKIK
jgi:hypothetical protein